MASKHGWGWSWSAAALFAALYLSERQRREALERALAGCQQRIAQLHGAILQLRRRGIDDQRLIASLRAEVAQWDQLIRQLRAA